MRYDLGRVMRHDFGAWTLITLSVRDSSLGMVGIHGCFLSTHAGICSG